MLRGILYPTKWKIAISLLPFIFPFFQMWLAIKMIFNLYIPIESFWFDVEEFIENFLYISETYIAYPFSFVLRILGWWSNNTLVVAPDGPLLPGSFAVAIIYALLIYVTWSVIAAWRQKNK